MNVLTRGRKPRAHGRFTRITCADATQVNTYEHIPRLCTVTQIGTA